MARYSVLASLPVVSSINGKLSGDKDVRNLEPLNIDVRNIKWEGDEKEKYKNKMCYIQVPPSHDECDHYVLQTHI